jgi:hypothetical protein
MYSSGDVTVLQMLLNKLGEPTTWTDSPTFGFAQRSQYAYAWSDKLGHTAFYRSEGPGSEQLEILGPLQSAAVYGQRETLAVLITWFRKNSPEMLLKICGSTSSTSLLYCAVYSLHHFGCGQRMQRTLKVINAVAGLLPDDIRYQNPSPLYLALKSANPLGWR